MSVANRLSTMQVLPFHRSKLRVPTEISLLGKDVHLYGERLVCQLCRHHRREPPGETIVVHSSEHQRAVKAAVKLRPRAA